jgi:protein arginine kinase activator
MNEYLRKCDGCSMVAVWHITDVRDDNQIEERHFCDLCYQKFLEQEEQQKQSSKGVGWAEAVEAVEAEEGEVAAQQECPLCGLKFLEFRNSGRLGCPNDYQLFQKELLPLLESIHGETRHCGKSPRRLPQSKQHVLELMQLRSRLKQAVREEDYEEAARLRDRIRQLEES